MTDVGTVRSCVVAVASARSERKRTYLEGPWNELAHLPVGTEVTFVITEQTQEVPRA
jgi:hypothetical protein